MPTSQLIIAPMMFLSGALFPMANLPGWLSVATKVNPLTYVVQPMRAAVFDHLAVPAGTRAVLDPAITWWGWQVPVGVQVLVGVAAAAAVLAAGILAFDRTE
jgi:ABC-2 type transport system permease protein